MVLSVKKALEIIEVVAREGKVGVRELSSKINMPRSTVSRLLLTLVESGYLAKDRDAGKYSLSYKLLIVGNSVLEHKGLREFALPVIKQVAADTRETVNLTVLDNFEVLFIEKIESPQTLKTGTKVGAKLLPHCTASGKIMLAQLSPQELAEYLSKNSLEGFTPKTITDDQTFFTELEESTKRGFAVSKDELLEGVSSVAAAIKTYPGKEIAALSIAVPSTRFSEENILELGKVVMAAAAKISNNFLG